MDRSLNPRLSRLDLLVGEWELTASSGERVMSPARSTFQWLGDRGFLVQRADRPNPRARAPSSKRFDGVLNQDHTAIDGKWEASGDSSTWSTDFDVNYRRSPG